MGPDSRDPGRKERRHSLLAPATSPNSHVWLQPWLCQEQIIWKWESGRSSLLQPSAASPGPRSHGQRDTGSGTENRAGGTWSLLSLSPQLPQNYLLHSISSAMFWLLLLLYACYKKVKTLQKSIGKIPKIFGNVMTSRETTPPTHPQFQCH